MPQPGVLARTARLACDTVVFWLLRHCLLPLLLLCCCGLLVLEMMTDFEVVLVARTRGQHVNIFDGYLYGIEIPWVEDIVVVAIFRGVR
jgi:hypothetical protein